MLNSNFSYFSQQFTIWVQDQMEFEFGDGKYQSFHQCLPNAIFAAEDVIYIIDGEDNWFYFVRFVEQLLPKLYTGHFNLTSLTHMDNFYGKNEQFCLIDASEAMCVRQKLCITHDIEVQPVAYIHSVTGSNNDDRKSERSKECFKNTLWALIFFRYAAPKF
jgi:hypothetical protein